MSAVPSDLHAAARTLGLNITSVLRCTDKTLLATGTLAGQPVAVKYLLAPDPFWAGKWRHERDVYRVFAETPPPICVPALRYEDGTRLLVLQWLAGWPLDPERYPQRGLTLAEVDAALAVVAALNAWPGPTSRFVTVFDYPQRIARYHAAGYLTEGDRVAATRLLDRCERPAQFNHGDPLASNILIREVSGPDSDGGVSDSAGTASLLDWEFAGLFLPGFDLAMLHTQLGANTPNIRERIDTMVAETGIEDPFVVNLVMVLTRELRIHRELSDVPLRQARLPAIEAAWAQARDRLHLRAGGRH